MARHRQRRLSGGVTLRHVAVEAGVSLMTVSNVINDRFDLMSGDTRKRVEAAIDRLSYRPNLAARSLRSARRLSVGMIVVDTSPAFLADPFTTHLVAGLSNYLNERGYVLALQGVQHDAVATATLLKSMRTDALCVFLSGSPSQRKEIIETVHNVNEPMIVFQERASLKTPDVCSIRQDDRDGGRWLAEHLLERGARRLVFLVPRLVWPAFSDRESGVRDVLRKSGTGAELRRVTYQGDFFVATQEALARDIDRHGAPDAVIGGNDQIAIAAIKLLEDRRLRVPKDVAVTGFNAFGFQQYSSPVLTTVKSPAYEMGARGAEEILMRLDTGRFADPEIVFPVEPLVGTSA